jgi:hypothetical protein
MTSNLIGPHIVRIPYQGIYFAHTMQLNLDCVGLVTPGTDFADIDVYTKKSGPIPLDDCLNAFMALVEPGYDADTNFGPAELYYVLPGTEDTMWIGAGVDAWTGTSEADPEPASELILTFRTYEGGIMRLTFLESVNAGNGHVPLGGRGAETFEGALWRYIIGDDGWILGKDTSYPIAPLNLCQGENEVLWRKHYRP